MLSLDLLNIPKHIAVIMDGNGRWAKSQGKDRLFGHAAGVEAVRDTLKAAKEFGVKYLTLYAFSTENWSRPQAEIDGLMDLLIDAITSELDSLENNGVRLLTIGDINGLPENCRKGMENAIEKTKENKGITLILALNYSARIEITKAVQSILFNEKNISADSITPELISKHLFTKNIPDPELLIRTSGENRVSNFMLWQIAYTELHFARIYWPEFRREHFIAAIEDYQNRERRFGKISEQIHPII
jgi:undecaprenyl diphosphate synthase